MEAAVLLIKCWIKVLLREQGILSGAQMPGQIWRGGISLAIPVGIAAYAGVYFLGEWRESIAQSYYFIAWYLTIAWGFLSAVSLFRFIPLLSPQAETLFLHTSPVWRGNLYIAKLVYSLLLNLLLFLAVSLPPLIAIGVWERGGGVYFAVLAVVAVVISLTSALAGALFAVPSAFFVRFIPERWRLQLRLPQPFQSAETMSGLYLLGTVALPLILAFDILTTPTSFVADIFARPLAVAAGGALFSLWAVLGPMVVLTTFFGLFLVVYTGISSALPFEERATSSKRIRPEWVKFCRRPLLKRELAHGWLSPIGGGLYAGAMAAVLVYTMPAYVTPLPPVMMTTFLLAAVSFFAANENANNPLSNLQFFFLMRVSPLSLLSFIFINSLVSFGKAFAGSLIATGLLAMALHLVGQPWEEVLISLPVLFACLVFPVVVGMKAVSLFGFSAKPQAVAFQGIVTLISWGLILVGGIAASLYILFPTPAQPFGQPLRLAIVALILSVGCAIGAYFLLRLAARRLARIEWL